MEFTEGEKTVIESLVRSMARSSGRQSCEMIRSVHIMVSRQFAVSKPRNLKNGSATDHTDFNVPTA
jgi:hypothetical protein